MTKNKPAHNSVRHNLPGSMKIQPKGLNTRKLKLYLNGAIWFTIIAEKGIHKPNKIPVKKYRFIIF